MDFGLVAATEDVRPVVRRLMELYRHDLAEFDGSDVDPHGEYGHRFLDHYWTDPDRTPFVFRVDGHWAGFSLVRAEAPFDMAEFFVMRKYRRRGIGQTAATELFRRYPDPWTVRQQKASPAATLFWRRAIPYPYTESSASNEIVQEFDSSVPAETGARTRISPSSAPDRGSSSARAAPVTCQRCSACGRKQRPNRPTPTTSAGYSP